MNDHERQPPPEHGETDSETTRPQRLIVPEPPSHRRRGLLAPRLPVLAALGVVAVPCIVVGAVNGLDRSSTSGLSAQSSQRPELPDAQESGAATGGPGSPSRGKPAREHAVPSPTRSGDRAGKSARAEENRPGPARTSPSGRPSSGSPSAANSPQGKGSSAPTRESPSSPGAADVLKRGDHGPEVTTMQRMLHHLGFYHGHRYGHFDSATEESVRRFQTWSTVADEVVEDERGTYGPATRDALVRQAS